MIPFTKMQGAGNDYVYVNCLETDPPANPAALARSMADRHFGIGGDGLILICPSKQADALMRMFNADGSESEMCGNGIRCVAKYLFDRKLVDQPQLTIETGHGVLKLEVFAENGIAQRVRVDMGAPSLLSEDIPTTLPGDPPINAPLKIDGRDLQVTCVSMGNPHCITYVDELTDEWVLKIGSKIEVDSHFPRRTNAEFVQIISPTEIRMRVWERGSGETLACGTGASAVCVAGVLTGRTERKILAHLPGGDLELEWDDNDHVYMTGPAVEVFSGEWPI